MKDMINSLYDKVKVVVFNPVTPMVLGIVNLAVAESLVGVTVGCILIVASIADWVENR